MENAIFCDHVLKNIFYFLIRLAKRDDYGGIKSDFLATRLTCKKWNLILGGLIYTSDCVNFDKQFAVMMDSLIYHYHMPYFPHSFESIINYETDIVRENIIPVDHCPFCNRLRLVISCENWCGYEERCGCARWMCRERIDPIEESCYSIHCSPCEDFAGDFLESKIRERAYMIWLHTGCQDDKKNYFQARKEILYPPKLQYDRNNF